MKVISLLFSVCILVFLTGCGGSPSECYTLMKQNIAAEKWDQLYDQLSKQDRKDFEKYIKVEIDPNTIYKRIAPLVAENPRITDHLPGDMGGMQKLRKLKGKKLFVGYMSLKYEKKGVWFHRKNDLLDLIPVGEYKSTKSDSDRTEITVNTDDGEAVLVFRKELFRWKLFIDFKNR